MTEITSLPALTPDIAEGHIISDLTSNAAHNSSPGLSQNTTGKRLPTSAELVT